MNLDHGQGAGTPPKGAHASFLSAIREFDPLSFQGRISCRDYWIAMVRAHSMLLISWVIYHKVMAELWGAYGEVFPWMVARAPISGKLAFGALALIVSAAWVTYAWLFSAAVVKRLHDRNLSWRLSLLYAALIAIAFFGDALGDFMTPIYGLLGLAGIIVFLFLGLVKGKTGPNRFGEDPLGALDMRIVQK